MVDIFGVDWCYYEWCDLGFDGCVIFGDYFGWLMWVVEVGG